MNDDTDDAAHRHIRIVEEAADWFARLNDGKPSAHHREAFAAWLKADERHLRAYQDIQRLWNGAGDVEDLKEYGAKLEKKRLTRRQLGAGIFLLAAGGAGWQAATRRRPDYETGTGERRTVVLPDGSTADLAAATGLSLDFSAATRRLVLHEGEAFFTVASSPGRPFSVQSAGAETVALGTAFSVGHAADGVRIVVAEHAVDVRAGDRSARIAAGQRTRVDNGALGPVEPADLETDLAWRDGRLIFTQAPLSDVVATINRWRPGRLVVMGTELSRRPVTFISEIARVDEVVDEIERALPVRMVGVTPWLTLIFPA